MKQLALTALVIGAAGAVLFAVLDLVLSLVYGAEILDAIWLFRILILASMLTMLTFSFEPALLSVNKPTLLLALRVFSAAIYAVVGLSLLGELGILSMGIAFLASQTVYVVSCIWFGARILKKRLRRLPADAEAAKPAADPGGDIGDAGPDC